MAASEPTIRPPQQPRSRASLERVIAAGTKLLEEEGYEGFTLAKVSSLANVSIGSIYARVKSKDDLFHVIQDRFMSRTENQPGFTDVAAWEHLPAEEMIVAAVREIGRVFQEDAPLLRVFMHRGLVDDVVGTRSFVERLALQRLLRAAPADAARRDRPPRPGARRRRRVPHGVGDARAPDHVLADVRVASRRGLGHPRGRARQGLCGIPARLAGPDGAASSKPTSRRRA